MVTVKVNKALTFEELLNYSLIGSAKKTKDSVWKDRQRRALNLIYNTMKTRYPLSVNLGMQSMNKIGYSERYRTYKAKYLGVSKGSLRVDLKLTGNLIENIKFKIFTPIKTANGKILKARIEFPPTKKKGGHYSYVFARYEPFELDNTLKKEFTSVMMGEKRTIFVQ